MRNPDVFALQSSTVNAFLFANVGDELNGSALTVLSVLARLGEDPWVVATEWAKLPRAAIVDRLAERILQMPLSEQARLDANTTSSRLSLLLLPERDEPSSQLPSEAPGTWALPKWALTAALYCAFAVAVGANAMLFAVHDGSVTHSATESVTAPAVPSVISGQ